jgi:4-hydroxybenzoyl-CoA reductase subunit beta
MRLPGFELFIPSSLGEAAEFLKAKGPDAKIIAGGTDLLVSMKQRNLVPCFLVHLKGIAALKGIRRVSEGGMKIGPLTKLAEIAASPDVNQSYPELARAAGSVGSYQIRNTGTLGGNICLDTKCYYYNQSSYWWTSDQRCRKGGGKDCYVLPSSKRGCFALLSGDTIPALIAYHASVRITSPEGERFIYLEELYTGQGIHYLKLEEGEILSEILLPPPDGMEAAFFKYVPKKTVDFAMISLAVSLNRSSGEARIVVGSVASGPLRLREAEDLLVRNSKDAIADEVGRVAGAELKMISSVRGSVHYKRELIPRLVSDAVKRIQGKGY